MELKDALDELGFKPDYKPTHEEVKREYWSLAKFFNPHDNRDEWKDANEMMQILNKAVKTIRDNFDKKNEWNIEDYIYKDVRGEEASQTQGYQGEIKLEGRGTVCRVNRELEKTPSRFEDSETIGNLMNEQRPYDWYIKLEGTRRQGRSSVWDTLNAYFEVGLPDFLLKFYKDTEQQIPRDLYMKTFGDNGGIRFRLNRGEVEVLYKELEDDEKYPLDKIANFTMKDIRLIEKIVFEEIHSNKYLANKSGKNLE